MEGKKPSYVDKFYMCACGRQALLVGAGRHPFAHLLNLVLTLECLCSLCCGAPPRTHTLPSLRAAGEEVSGHLALPLHLDETPTVQLVPIAVQHMVKVCGHLTEDTDIDKGSGILSIQNTSMSSSDQAVNAFNIA